MYLYPYISIYEHNLLFNSRTRGPSVSGGSLSVTEYHVRHSSLQSNGGLLFLIFDNMNTDNFETNDHNHTHWVQIISWVVTSVWKFGSSFTVLSESGSHEIIKCSNLPHVMKNVSEWVQVIVEQTKSGPKTISTYPSIKDTVTQSPAEMAAETIARAASHNSHTSPSSDAKMTSQTLS